MGEGWNVSSFNVSILKEISLGGEASCREAEGISPVFYFKTGRPKEFLLSAYSATPHNS